MTEPSNLDKAKTAYYEDAQATLKGDPSPIDQAGVDAIFASLNPEEDRAFEYYRMEVDATMYDFLMKDFSTDLRAAIDLFIKDGVQRIAGEGPVTAEQRRDALSKVGPIEAMTALQLLDHHVVQAKIFTSLMDRGFTPDDIEEKLNAMKEAA